MKVEIKIDPQCDETAVLIIAKEIDDEVNELFKNLSRQNLHVVVGFKDDRATALGVEEIIRIYAAMQKVFIVTDDGEYISKLRLYELEERLPSNKFVRTCNSEIVNLQKVRDFDLSFSGRIGVRFLDGSVTYVSRRYVTKIKKILGL
ncbi:MAG: LytTR family transcriptional regulator [Defluviitaleaceae bacterium]|nr:LytTR family transcriptional regulator [Defluviitaleaceae bacterium]